MRIIVIQINPYNKNTTDSFIHVLTPALHHNTCVFTHMKWIPKDFVPMSDITVIPHATERTLLKSTLEEITKPDYHPDKSLIIITHQDIPNHWKSYIPVIIRFTNYDGYIKTYENDTYVAKFRVNFDKHYEKYKALKKLAHKYVHCYAKKGD